MRQRAYRVEPQPMRILWAFLATRARATLLSHRGSRDIPRSFTSTRGLRAPIRCPPNRRTNSAPHDGGGTLGLSARCGRDIRISVGRAIRLAQHTRRSSSLARLAAAVAITWRHRVIQETRLNLTCAHCRNAAQKFTAQDAPECCIGTERCRPSGRNVPVGRH
jgi:hypothetical protein